MRDRISGIADARRLCIADLVLLHANPLEDITNTQRIAAVIANGRHLPEAKQKKMLVDTEAAAAQAEARP